MAAPLTHPPDHKSPNIQVYVRNQETNEDAFSNKVFPPLTSHRLVSPPVQPGRCSRSVAPVGVDVPLSSPS